MYYVIDGNNVIFSAGRHNPQLNRLLNLISTLKPYGKLYPIVSHSLKFRIKENEKLNQAIKDETIFETPSDVDTDTYLLEIAKKLEGKIISRDKFREYRKLYPKIIGRTLPYMFVRNNQGIDIPILPWLKDEHAEGE